MSGEVREATAPVERPAHPFLPCAATAHRALAGHACNHFGLLSCHRPRLNFRPQTCTARITDQPASLTSRHGQPFLPPALPPDVPCRFSPSCQVQIGPHESRFCGLCRCKSDCTNTLCQHAIPKWALYSCVSGAARPIALPRSQPHTMHERRRKTEKCRPACTTWPHNILFLRRARHCQTANSGCLPQGLMPIKLVY